MLDMRWITTEQAARLACLQLAIENVGNDLTVSETHPYAQLKAVENLAERMMRFCGVESTGRSLVADDEGEAA